MKTLHLKIKNENGKEIVNQRFSFPNDQREDLIVEAVESIVERYNHPPAPKAIKEMDELILEMQNSQF
jgi:hypothetical protein